jgi:hypothetical protein
MKLAIAAYFSFLLIAAPASGQWKLVTLTATGPENHPNALATDLWLKIELKNDSDQTFYVPGLWGSWYMIESYIKANDGLVWKRRNVGVDQPLVATRVAPGAIINAGGRYSQEDVGRLMLLTFVICRSENDTTGTPILLGPFTVPAPAGTKPAAEPGKN